jgi:hypothetical protein
VKGINCILAEAVGPSHCPYVFVFKEKEGSHVNVHKKEFLLVYYIKKNGSHKLNNAFSEKKGIVLRALIITHANHASA